MKRIFLILMLTLLTLSTVSAFDFDNKATYSNNDLKVTIDNGFGLLGEIGTIELKSHNQVDQVLDVGIGTNLTVMYYDFDFQDVYENGLGTVEFFDMENKGLPIDKEFHFAYLGDKEVDDYETTCSTILDKNGTSYESCDSAKSGSHIEKAWIDFNSKDIPQGKIRIALVTDVPMNSWYDAKWTIAGKKIDKHAQFSSWLANRVVGCWTLDETSGSTAVDYGLGQLNNGTINFQGNTSMMGATSQIASLGKAYYFNKTNNTNVSMIPSSSLNIPNDFSLGVVFNSTDIADNQIAGGRINVAGYHSAFTSGAPFTKVVTSGGSTAVTGTANVANGVTNMMVTTHSVTNSSIFINGALNVTTNSSAGTITNSDTWTLGGSGAFVGFSGYLSEVWLLNYTMNSTDVSDIYNSGNITSCTVMTASTTPTITLLNPTDGQQVLDSSITLAVSITDPNNATGLNVTFYSNKTGSWSATSINSSAYNNTQVNFTSTFSTGVYLWGVTASDGLGTTVSSNRTFSVNKLIFFNQSSYENQTSEATSTAFGQNFTIDTDYTPSTVYLNYNNTNYSASFGSINSTSYQASVTVTTPGVSTNTVIPFNWIVELDDNSLHYSSTNNQTVTNIGVDNCSVYTNVIYNFTIFDEENPLTKLVNTTTEYSFNIYGATRTTLISSTNTSTASNPFAICLNTPLNNNLSLDGTVRFYANNSDTNYAIRYYNFLNSTLSNSTLNRNISLYDVNASRSLPFLLTFRDSNLALASNILVNVYKQYLPTNDFKIVEIPLTDTNGQTILNLIRNAAVYNLIMINSTGDIVASFTNIVAFCQDYTIGSCSIELNAPSTGQLSYNYDEDVGISYTVGYSNTTKLISVAFNSLNTSNQNVRILVTTPNQFENQSVCDTSLTSASGTLTCNVSSFLETNQYFYVGISANEVFVENVLINANPYLEAIGGALGSNGFFLAALLLLFLILLFADDRQVLVFVLAIGWVAVISLGLIKGALIGIGSSGIWLLITIIIFIWKLKGEEVG